MASTRQLILAEITDRVETIRVASGFQTDAGAAVYVGEVPELGPDDPDVAIAIVARDESPRENDIVEWPILLAAVTKVASPSAASGAIEAILADVKAAIETPGDQTLGGLVKWIARGGRSAIPREAGSLTAGALIPYTVTFIDRWGS